MLEQMKSVSNPLTIIALFAALAEVAGTVAIKLVAPEMQPTFIWFVMLFPTLIVVLFFVTLNFNAKVLYAPGDFRNEENYLAVVNTKQGLGIEKIQLMLSEAKTEIISEVMKTVSANGTDERRKIEEIIQDKLQPVQFFADNLKTERATNAYLLFSVLSQEDKNKTYAIWQLLDSTPLPMTLKAIASKLNWHEYIVSRTLETLIRLYIVIENTGEGEEKTYSLIPSPSTSGTDITFYRSRGKETKRNE